MPSDTIVITLDQRSPILAVIDASAPFRYGAMERRIFLLDKPLPDKILSVYYEMDLRMSDNEIMTDGEVYSADFGLYTSEDKSTWTRKSGRSVSGVVHTVERINEMMDLKRPSREVPISCNQVIDASMWSGKYFAVSVTSKSEQIVRGPRIMVAMKNG